MTTLRTPLDTGEGFPALTVDLAAGGTLELPLGLAGRWAVVLVYRGKW
jgi:hypothetical protein